MTTGHGFATTRWTMVNAAGRTDEDVAARALAELCQAYWPPLYAYLRRRGYAREEAEDLTQGFFARLLERGTLRAADRERGRFRGFLLTALKRHVINEHERTNAAKRGGPFPLRLDFADAEHAYATALNHADSPERLFDRNWALVCVHRAIDGLRTEYEAARKGEVAAALLPYLTEGGALPSYGAVADQLGMSEGAVKVAVHRLRQRFGVVLRAQIADTVASPAEVDDEMRTLLRALVS